MKIIGLDEHYRLPAIEQLAKADEPYMLMKAALTKSGMYKTDPQGGWPAGINDLGAGRIAAMDAAGIDVQILSHAVPGVETVEPSRAVSLATQANDAVAAAIASYPDRLRGFATLPMLDPAAAAREAA
jgi:predicted TIM-barrel fold metal-dependent hydrolase